MEELVAAQRRFFHTDRTKDLAFRQKMLTRLEEGLRKREGALLTALERDLNKQPYEGYMCELALTLAELREAKHKLGSWARPRRRPTPLAHFPSKSAVYREPYGVALIMAPWNYPLFLTLAPLVSALAAGCCAVVKPSAYAPATSAALAALLGECFPAEYVAVVEGGRQENAALLEQKFDYIFFTGSPAVGRTVMEAAARHLTPVTLELGGKSPVLVAPDADLTLAARRIIWGKCLNAGQTCVAPDHVWVHRKSRDALVEELRRSIAAFYGQRPLEGRELPKIINGRHFDRLCALLSCGKIAVGGQTDPVGLRIAPTVLVDVTEDDGVMGEEIFGPILPVLVYDDFDALIERQRRRERPLALYLFTRSAGVEAAVRQRLSYGGGCVNDTVVHLATPHLPFGGVGGSGMGACHGEAGFLTFTHEKSILKKGRLDVPLRYPPYGGKDMGLLKRFL